MNQKRYTNIILVILVVVLAGAVGCLTLVKKQTLSAPTPTPIPNPTPTSNKKLDFSQFEKICAYNEQYHNYKC